MRATEALELSNPANEIDFERVMRCTHLDLPKNWVEIKKARIYLNRIKQGRGHFGNGNTRRTNRR